MKIALILFALPLIAIIWLIINNTTLRVYNYIGIPSYISEGKIMNGEEEEGEEEKDYYVRGIKPKYKIIKKEKKDIIVSLIISIINLLIIIIALLKYDPNVGNFQYQLTIYGKILGG